MLRPRISFFWFRIYQASSPRLALWNWTHIDAALVVQLGDRGDLGSQIFAAAGRGSLSVADHFAALDRGDLGSLRHLCSHGVVIALEFGTGLHTSAPMTCPSL